MKLMASVLTTCVLVAAATNATAGALDECMIRGDQAVVRSCLVEADREAQLALNKAEGDAGKRARDIDTATGRPGAAVALAKSMRAFVDYRKAQCEFVRAMYASGNGADQGQLACMVDMTRRRVRDFPN